MSRVTKVTRFSLFCKQVVSEKKSHSACGKWDFFFRDTPPHEHEALRTGMQMGANQEETGRKILLDPKLVIAKLSTIRMESFGAVAHHYFGMLGKQFYKIKFLQPVIKFVR